MKNLRTLALLVAILFATTPVFAEWTGEIFAGYNSSSGNTDKGQASLSAKATQKWDDQRLMGKFSAFYSESDNVMDGQKWDALVEYAFDFGDENRWFNIYKTRVDHDRFADVDYRVTPSVGIGYHFAREEDWTWNADASIGYEVTEYRSALPREENAVFILGTFLKKKVFTNAFISEDLTLIPGLESGAGYRIKSETAFTNPINEVLDLEVKYLVDYDSEPAAGKTSTDKQIVAGIKYKF